MPNRIITSMFCAAVAIAAMAQTETHDSTITQEPNAIIGRGSVSLSVSEASSLKPVDLR